MATTEEEYCDRFNVGYKILKYQPDIYAMLKSSLTRSDERQAAILDGGEQAALEQEQAKECERLDMLKDCDLNRMEDHEINK